MARCRGKERNCQALNSALFFNYAFSSEDWGVRVHLRALFIRLVLAATMVQDMEAIECYLARRT